MKKLVIGFCGKIGSGKTTISQLIANDLRIKRVGFGDYIRLQALKKSLEVDRKTLQDLGEDFINENAKDFCWNVLFQDNWNANSALIVDGIRHIEILEIIKDIIYPLEFKLIYIDVSYHIRKERLNNVDINQIDHHSTELQVDNKLKNKADLIVDGSKSFESIKSDIIKWYINI
jgi:dephospho-CoA kinase